MEPHAIEIGTPADAIPGIVDVHLMATLLPAGKHPRVARHLREIGQYLHGRGRQRHDPPARLAVPQSHLARLEVQIVPGQSHDLVSPAPGQDQESDRRGRLPRREPFRRGDVQYTPEPRQFLRRQEPLLVRLHLVAAHRLAGVSARRTHLPQFGQVEHLHQHVHRAVRDCRHLPQPVLEFQDVLALHFRDPQVAQAGQDVLPQHEAVVLPGDRFAVHVDVFAQIAFAEVRDRGFGSRVDERFSVLDAGDEPGGLLTSPVGRELAVAAHGHAFGLAPGPCLDHVDLATRRVNAHPEAGEFSVPEQRVLAIDREAVHDALGEGAIVAVRHVVVRRKITSEPSSCS